MQVHPQLLLWAGHPRCCCPYASTPREDVGRQQLPPVAASPQLQKEGPRKAPPLAGPPDGSASLRAGEIRQQLLHAAEMV